jgi:hypothetical protein
MGAVLAVLPVFVVMFIRYYFDPDFRGESLLSEFKETVLTSKVFILCISFVLPIIWLCFPLSILKMRFVNFLQHSVGGGVAVALGIVFVIESLRRKFPILNNLVLQFFFIFLFVSGLGVANEILEFVFDTLKIGIFSNDRLDTWYDLLANTTGGVFVFALYRMYILVRKMVG